MVSYNIEILKREGLIRKDDGVSRGLGLVSPRHQRNQETVAVPLVGSIAAGEPFPLPTAETWASAADLDTVDPAATDRRPQRGALRLERQG